METTAANQQPTQAPSAGQLFGSDPAAQPAPPAPATPQADKYKTAFRASAHCGYIATTYATVRGKDYEITTMKRSGGRILSVAQSGILEKGDGYNSFQYAPFTDPSIKLAERTARATEKAVKECHAEGLQAFARFEAEEAMKPAPYQIEVGQVFFSDGPWDSRRRAVYEIQSRNNFKTVTLDGEHLCTDTHVRSHAEKFGIGTYYKEGDKITPEEVAALVEKATTAERERLQARQQAEAEELARVAALIDAGAEIVQEVPEWAQSVIIAQLQKDTSDPMSDYFASTTEKTIFLAWSHSKRQNFEEMRAACSNCDIEEVRKFADKPEKPADAREGWEAPDENRENHSMGAGYYLGDRKYSGWHIRKVSAQQYRDRIETLQQAAGEGRYFIPEAAPQKYEGGTGNIVVRENREKNGIEVIFADGKPATEALDKLKRAGFRWSRFQKLWYATNTAHRLEVANNL